MCKGPEPSTLPAYRLEERHGAWRLAIAVASAPEVELSGEALRLRLAGSEPGAPATTLPVPARAQPVDLGAARCTFSRRRGELIIEWPCSSKRPEEKSAKEQRQDRPEIVEEPQTASSSLPPAVTSSNVEEEEVEVGCGTAAQEAQVVHEQEVSQQQQERLEEEKDKEAQGEEEEEQEEEEATPALSAEEWRTRGNEAVKAGDSAEAVRCYSAGLAAGGGDVAMLHSNRALCLQKLGRHEEAVEDARACVALRPDFFKGYLRGAMSLRALGKPEEALTFMKRCPPNDEAGALVAELKPEAAAAEEARLAALGGAERAKEEGNVLFRKGLFEAALAKYTEAVDLCEEPEGTLALALRNNRAACYHQLSDFSSVVADATFVLAREPRNLKALVRRMLALEPLERYETALEDARAVLQQDPRHEAANKMQHRLSRLVREMGRTGGA